MTHYGKLLYAAHDFYHNLLDEEIVQETGPRTTDFQYQIRHYCWASMNPDHRPSVVAWHTNGCAHCNVCWRCDCSTVFYCKNPYILFIAPVTLYFERKIGQRYCDICSLIQSYRNLWYSKLWDLLINKLLILVTFRNYGSTFKIKHTLKFVNDTSPR